jgi:hypothetical protein
MRDKKKTKNIKVRDLKPKKDAKGGRNPNVHQGNVHQGNLNQSGPAPSFTAGS